MTGGGLPGEMGPDPRTGGPGLVVHPWWWVPPRPVAAGTLPAKAARCNRTRNGDAGNPPCGGRTPDPEPRGGEEAAP